MTGQQNLGRLGVLLAALCATGLMQLRATSYYWDANGEDTGTGGAGIWDAASTLWRNGSSTGALEAWPNTDPVNEDRAVITGTAGNITLNSDSHVINVNRIYLNSGSILAPASGTAVLNLSGSTPTIEVPQYKNLSITAGISGGSLTKTAAGMLALRGSSTYTDGTYHVGGGIAIGHADALGTGTLYLNGGTLSVYGGTALAITNSVIVNSNFGFSNNSFGPSYGAALTLTGPVVLTGSRLVSINILGLTINGVVSDEGNGYGLTYTSGSYGNTFTLGANNTFSGGLILNANANANLNLGNMGALGTGPFTINGNGGKINNTSGVDGTLANNIAQTWNGDFTFVGSKSLHMGMGAVSLGSAAGAGRTVTVNANTLTVGGAISDGVTAVMLTKIGAGTLAIAGAGTYTGGTTVTNGTLSVEVGGVLGTGGVTVAPPGKVVLKQSAGIADDATVTLQRIGSTYGKVELSADVVERVGSVVLDGVTYDAPGTSFGAVGTGSTVESNDYFLGSGQLKITSPATTMILLR